MLVYLGTCAEGRQAKDAFKEEASSIVDKDRDAITQLLHESSELAQSCKEIAEENVRLRNGWSKLSSQIGSNSANLVDSKVDGNFQFKVPAPSLIRPSNSVREKIPILVFCFNRPESLRRTLNSIAEYLEPDYPLFISQDGAHEGVRQVILSASSNPAFYQKSNITRFQFDWSESKVKPGESIMQHMMHYYKIAAHYEFALEKIFSQFGFDKVIILEGVH